MLYLNEDGVEVFISRYKSNNRESYWDNYDLVLWNKTPNGFSHAKGLFRKNAWGMFERFQVNSRGLWVLPKKYVKHFR